MLKLRSRRCSAIVAPLVFLALCGSAQGALSPDAVEGLKADASEVLEVQVQGVQVPEGQKDRFDVLYRMEVLSVLRSASRVHPGETITVRSYGVSKEALDRGLVGPKVPALLEKGWIGTAYLNRDPKASGPDAQRQFAIAAHGDSFEQNPPGPPSMRYIEGSTVTQ